MIRRRWLCGIVLAALAALGAPAALALERQDVIFKVFQFPPDKIPTIDGNADDWAIVPDSYAIGMDQLEDTEAPGGHGTHRDPKDLDVKVKVGWVKGLNRLYFLYQAYDNYWDFSRLDLHNDIFEVVVDGDLSGGPLIDISHRDLWTPKGWAMANIDPRISKSEAFFSFQGVHAQNYHIFTPAVGKDWVMAWECANYVKEMPYANHAQVQLQAGRIRHPGAGVLDHALRLRRLRGSAARGGVGADRKQAHRPVLGGDRLR